MVWAPDAVWDAEKEMYLVHWSSHFFAESDPEHLGTHTLSCIRFAYTADFRTFTKPADFVKTPDTSIIDLALLHIEGSSYVRFLKNQTTNDTRWTSNVYMETTTTGLHGQWHRPGGEKSFIYPNCEGPYAWWDNRIGNKAYLLLDDIGLENPQYIPFEARDFNSQASWCKADAPNFQPGRRHGSVIGIDEARYHALRTQYGLDQNVVQK